MNDEIKLELEELNDFKGMIHSETFKKFILLPIEKELSELKDAYDCDSLKELYRIKGQKKGLKFVKGLTENIDTKIENKQFELEGSEEA